MYLVDTNVWLELLLDQGQAGEVREFLQRVPTEHLAMTDFSFHSICLILCRFDQTSALETFVDEAFTAGATQLVHVPPGETSRVVAAMAAHKLDFDDAYQVVAGDLHDLDLISFDADLDRGPRGRVTPAQVRG